MMPCLRDFGKYPRERHELKIKVKWVIMLAGRCWSSWAVMPEGPGDLCLRWCMIFLSSLVVMGGKSGPRLFMLE